MKAKWLISLLIAVLVGCAAAAFSFSRFQEQFELGVLNYWFLLRGQHQPPSQIAIVAMDELSYRDLNVPLNQAWPRRLHAELLQRFRELGVQKAVFDVLFLDAGADPEADKALAEALQQMPSVLGIESAIQNVAAGSGTFSIEEILEPYAPFARAASGLALVGLPEEQGVVRRFMTTRTERTAEFPTLSEAAVGFAPDDSKPRPGPRDLINYYGPARTFPTYSFYQVLQRERPISADLFKGKTVFVGLALRTDTGPAQKDVFGTSYGGRRIFGTEVHATAAANLLEGNWIRRASGVSELLGQTAAATALSFLLLNIGPVAGFVLVLLCLAGWALLAFLMFTNGTFLPGAVLVCILLPTVYLVSTLYFYVIARRSAKQLQNAFELYLSPETARQLSQGDSAAALGGSKLWATALFTDIQDFTKITEEMPAERVAEMLNAYFTEVMEVVFQNNGTLIKFIGDAVFVLWGAPVRIDNHAELAVRTALALSKEVDKFNASQRFPALRTRIGINTGPMVVGNLGSKRRFDYTAIGDSVNLASRVEGLNKYLGTQVLFTEATKKDAGSNVTSLRVAQVVVAGKSEAVWLYTAFEPPASARIEEVLSEGIEQFRKRRFEEALGTFRELKMREPRLDTLCELYCSLSESYKDVPPPEGWAGELEFSSK